MKNIEIMKQEMQDVLENNILRFWIDKMTDNEHGGYYGRVDGHGVLTNIIFIALSLIPRNSAMKANPIKKPHAI